MAKKKEIAKYILLGIGAVAALGTVIVFPGIGPMLKWVVDLVEADRRVARKSLRSLERRGMLRVKQSRRTVRIVLTEKGKRQMLRYQLRDLTIPKPASWDGKWRIVMFDIPESQRATRDTVRDILRKLRFARVHRSVFIHPYPCTNVVHTLRSFLGLEEGTLYIFEARVLEDEKALRKHFRI